jgi:zinc protease
MPPRFRYPALSLALGALLLMPPVTRAAPVVERELPNGLTVLLQEDHSSPLAVFQVWYRVGSMDEVSGRSGASHLLEHMMFKGTAAHGSKDLSRAVQRVGGSDNAFTSRDYTAYFQTLPADRLHLSLEFEPDRMANLLMDPADVAAERSVVMEERRLRTDDDPQSDLFEEAVAAAFKVHAYRRPVIGWMEDLAQIGPDDLLAHYRSYYCPDNAHIVVVGDMEPEVLVGRIEKAFSGIPPCAERKSLISAEPRQRGERRVTLQREAELPYVLALFHTPSFPHEDAYALEVLATVLSGGKSGRLYERLVYERELALEAFASYSGVSRDPFLFFLGGTAAPGTGADALEEALLAEVDALKAGLPSAFELQKAKNQVEADFIMGQDSIFAQALLLGRFEAIGDWRLKDRYLPGIQAVTAEDVRRVARTYLVQENRTIGVLLPVGARGATGSTEKTTNPQEGAPLSPDGQGDR